MLPLNVRTLKRRLVAAVAGALLLSGCGASSTPTEPLEGYYTEWIKLDNGRIVECVVLGRGISCDWDGARRSGGVS